jgi:hypothetical protein
LAALLLVAVLSGPAGAELIIDSINYKIALEDFSGPAGFIVKMPVQLKNEMAIGGFLFRIEYDTALLTPIAIGNEGPEFFYDSLELVDRGWQTINIDSINYPTELDTSYNIWAFHDLDDTLNLGALFIRYLQGLEYTTNLPPELDEPSTILNFLFQVDPAATIGTTAEITVRNYSGPGTEYRRVQLTDTAGLYTIYPGDGPIYATCTFTVIDPDCGDLNDDSSVNILDIAFLINYLYNDGPAPDPLNDADVDGSGDINILDITYLIAFLYTNGPPPDCN